MCFKVFVNSTRVPAPGIVTILRVTGKVAENAWRELRKELASWKEWRATYSMVIEEI